MIVVKRITALMLLICVLLCVCACGEGGEDARIYVALESMPNTLDGQTAESDSELLIVRNIYEGLTRQNEKGEIVLAACEKYDFSNLTYTFTLRDDLKWSDGEPLTANDFVFGLKRALLPETQAPFARLLYAVKNASLVHSGAVSPDTLGIFAENEKTLRIELTYDDKDFLRTLSMPVSMPCREDFFLESTGKYGLEKEYVLSCGSYKLARWNKVDNGIRLYKNDEYTGKFTLKNGGVFIAKDKDKTVAEKLISGKADMAILASKYLPDIPRDEINLKSIQNICWVLSLGGEFTPNIRQALCMCCSPEVYGGNLPQGFAAAKSVFPEVLGVSGDLPQTTYDSVTARTLISEEIKNFKNKKFPQTTLIYSDSEPMRPVITEMVGDWQKNLSTFINIKPTDKSLESELKEHSLSLAVFPVKADSTVGEYLYKFGVTSSGNAVDDIAATGNYNLLPIAYEDTTVGYLNNIDGVYINATGGYIDFSYIIKN